MMHATQALDLHVDLTERLGSGRLRDVVTVMIEEQVHLSSGRVNREGIEGIVDRVHNGLRVGLTYYVTADMADLVTHVATQFDGTDHIRLDLAPSDAGFVYFDKPLTIIDVRGVPLKVSALTWIMTTLTLQSEDGSRRPLRVALISEWNDQYEAPDEVALRLREEFENLSEIVGRWGMIAVDTMAEHDRLGPSWVPPSEEARQQILADGAVPQEFTNIHRLVWSLWTLLGQTITTVAPAEVGRASQRRAKRKGIPARVTVIDLRKVDNPERIPGETQVEWSHRWWSRGHLRWQHVSEHHPLAEPDGRGGWVARVYVHGSVKGPADKPLVVTDKVHALRR